MLVLLLEMDITILLPHFLSISSRSHVRSSLSLVSKLGPAPTPIPVRVPEKGQDCGKLCLFAINFLVADGSGKDIPLNDLPLDRVKQLNFEFCAPEGAACSFVEVSFVHAD